MYFAAAIEQAGHLARTRAVCRSMTLGLDDDLIAFLGGEGIADVYNSEHLDLVLVAAGSVLKGPNAVLGSIAGAGFKKLRKEAVRCAAGPMVASAWFSLQYPLMGGVLQAIPFASAFFGPPAWLVTAVAQSSIWVMRTTWSVGNIKHERRQEVRFLKAALPALHSMAHSDGRFSLEEFRLFKDVSGRNPHRSDLDISAYLREIRGDTPHASLERIGAQPLSKSQKKSLIELCVIMAHADGIFDDHERGFMERLGVVLGLAKPDLADYISSMEARYYREQELAEATIRGMCYLLKGNELSLEEAVLLDMQLMNLVPAESKREQICNKMMRERRVKELRLPKNSLALNALKPPTGYKSLVRRLNTWKARTPLDEDIEAIARSIAGFVVALEVVDDPAGDPPQTNHQVRTNFETYMLHLGFPQKKIARVLKDAVKMASDSKKQDEELKRKLSGSSCPQCGGSSFSLEGKAILRGAIWRDVYECSKCNSKLLRCRFAQRGCNNLILKGDVYDDEFCQEHNPLSIDKVKGWMSGE